METLSARKRAERRREGPRTRLTQRLTDDIVAAVRIGTPLQLCYEYAGVPSSTVAYWMRLAEEASRKPAANRSQLERRCLVFREAMRRAQGEAGLRTHRAIADAAGITPTRPKSTVTRRKIVGPDVTVNAAGEVTGGAVVEVIIEDREVPPDWRAAKAIGQYRWPAEMGDTDPLAPEGVGAQSVSPRALWERLQQIRAARTDAGLDQAAIEATATVADPPVDDAPR
ncbi:MAG: hypothetical protein KGH75_00395 [Rhodospirillales bacterium]|nr:hypothetical protein [Rhodospirillales bacterium]